MGEMSSGNDSKYVNSDGKMRQSLSFSFLAHGKQKALS